MEILPGFAANKFTAKDQTRLERNLTWASLANIYIYNQINFAAGATVFKQG